MSKKKLYKTGQDDQYHGLAILQKIVFHSIKGFPTKCHYFKYVWEFRSIGWMGKHDRPVKYMNTFIKTEFPIF